MISYQQFAQFEQDYRQGKYPHERFGQAFENTFPDLCPQEGAFGDGDPRCVFYVEDEGEARKKIFEHWVREAPQIWHVDELG